MRDTKSKEATHFITHYAERVGNKERIDAKSQYDKSTDERWFSLNADALKKIVALRDTKHTPHSKVEVVNVKTLEKHLAGVDMDKSKNETTSKVVDFSEFVDKTKS